MLADNDSGRHPLTKIYQRLSSALGTFLLKRRYSIYSKYISCPYNLSFAQEGEDLVLNRIFEKQKEGFYIDVGAHHPQRFSNTYFFYLKGWRGINIDAMPGSMKLFEEIRPKDMNIEAAISNVSEALTYYMFNDPALNGFSKPISTDRDTIRGYKIVDRKTIKTQKLSDLLEAHLPEDQTIDFLSIDVEGLDYQVLLSNDWLRYKPTVLLVEELATSLGALPGQSKTFQFLQEQGYELLAKTCNTSFYRLAVVS